MEWVRAREARHNEALFFSNLPTDIFKKLQAVEATCLNLMEDATQPSCCRELIFTEPDILISPCCALKGKIYIVLMKTKIESKEFQQKLQRLSIKLENKVDVTTELFQYCLVFTLMHRIAPLWNRVGDCLVQGKSFLEEIGKLNTVRVNITVTDKICMSLQASQLKLPQPQIQDFGLSNETLEKFSTKPDYAIEHTSIENNCCVVLPSTKRGFIALISKDIAENSCFKSYEALRKHWKLMYGYHLPSKACSEFYNVRFFGERTFIYPSYCIRSQDPVSFLRCNHDAIYKLFLDDVIARMPTVCGIPIRFNGKPLSPEVKLCEANLGNQIFLKSKPPTDRFNCVDFIKSVAQKSTKAHENDSESSVRDAGQLCLISSHEAVKIIPKFTNQRATKTTTSVRDHDKNQIPKRLHCVSPKVIPTVSSQKTIQDQIKVKPSFGQHLQKKAIPTQRKLTAKKDEPSKPQKRSFEKKKPGKTNVAKEIKFTKRKQNEGCKDSQSTDKQKSLNENISLAVIEPQFNQNTRKSNKHHESNPEGSFEPNFESFKDAKKLVDGKILIDRKKIFSSVQSEDEDEVFEQTSINYRSQKIISSDSGHPLAAQNQNLCLAQDNLRNPGYDADTLLNLVQSNKAENSIAVNLAMEILFHASATDSDFLSRLDEMDLDLIDFESQMKAPKAATKRNKDMNTDQTETSCSPAKKPRAKPKIQGDVDIGKMAAKNELKKVNSVTLKAWLKERGIQVKSSSKKEELISKVEGYVKAHRPEE